MKVFVYLNPHQIKIKIHTHEKNQSWCKIWFFLTSKKSNSIHTNLLLLMSGEGIQWWSMWGCGTHKSARWTELKLSYVNVHTWMWMKGEHEWKDFVSIQRYVRFHSLKIKGENQSLLEKCLRKNWKRFSVTSCVLWNQCSHPMLL